MSIREVHIWSEAIPLRFAFKHTLAERRQSGSLLLRVTLADGVAGWGEALPRPYVTGETVESCLTALRERIVPMLTTRPLADAAALGEAILALHDDAATGGDLAAIAAIELALVDALARRHRLSLYEFLGRPRRAKTVIYSMVIGGGEKTTRKLSLFSRLLGIRQVKIKVGSDIAANERLAAIVRRVHPRARLRVDANCAWTLAEAREHLRMLRRFDIEACEQPLAADDIEGHARLTAEHPDLLICADESLRSFADARLLARERAFSAFNIRLSKNGGILNALRIHELATRAGIVCQLGAQVGETALISVAGRLFAGMAGDLRFHEGSFGTFLIKEDVTREAVRFGLGGRASTRSRGAGLGLTPELARVERHATETTEILPAAAPEIAPPPAASSHPPLLVLQGGHH